LERDGIPNKKEFFMTEKKITKDMSIVEIVQKYPQTLEVFAKYGLGCIGCAAARFENLEAGAKVHGVDVEKFVDDLNAAAA
jgi:hybrid cluster-associated redox disulfide protein